MKWLTPEEAIAAANLTATANKLNAIAKNTNGKKTPEESFHALGLLFDRERYQAGQLDFLKLLHSSTDEEQTDKEDELNQENLEAASNNKESSNSASSTQTKSEPYIFEQCKVQVVITLLPSTGQPGNRPVLLAASSHGDFPVVAMLTQEELGSLPPVIALDDQLLRDAFTPLCAELANAEIERKEGEPIRIIKKPGRKGVSPLEFLIAVPEEVNPAVQMCYQLRQYQMMTGIDWRNAEQWAAQIEEAIATGIAFTQAVNHSLKALTSCTSTSGGIPEGF
jgi:hypothetical protein